MRVSSGYIATAIPLSTQRSSVLSSRRSRVRLPRACSRESWPSPYPRAQRPGPRWLGQPPLSMDMAG
jgi:hypothetical protein